MNVGLVDADSHNFPNLPLMKISAYHKAKGDSVEWAFPMKHYDRVYVSRVFGEEYTQDKGFCYNADEVFFGGTGYAISVENGREVYRKERDKDLPDEIEHQYPDYDLYPELTKDKAFGFMTRGCPNNCGFCIISQKEGRVSHKVADLSEFWRGQREIKLLDANLLACKDRADLLRQLAESRAEVDFTQGLDARFMTTEIAQLLGQIKIKAVHFAFDQMKNAERIIEGLELFKRECPLDYRKSIVYMLTNYDTTLAEDFYRLRAIRERGYMPDVRIYRKETAPQILKDLQRWCNSRFIYRSCDFADYKPREGKTIKELYPNITDWGYAQ
jgi:hypothetical protein